jgi:hypothetical protein
VRILAVIGDELIGADEGRDWAVMEALVAANGPASIDVHVLTVVNRPRESMLFGMPLGRAVGRTSLPRATGYDAGESARQRLDRALQHLRDLGLRVSGEVAEGDAYHAVRRQVAKSHYDRVLLLLHDRGPLLTRLVGRGAPARLKRSLPIPVDAPRPSDIVAPDQ